jgi:hypothetical protein
MHLKLSRFRIWWRRPREGNLGVRWGIRGWARGCGGAGVEVVQAEKAVREAVQEPKRRV